MGKPMGASNKNKASPAKGSPKRTGRKINQRLLSDQQKVNFINEKPSTPVAKSKLKPGIQPNVPEVIQDALLAENSEYLATENGEYIIFE